MQFLVRRSKSRVRVKVRIKVTTIKVRIKVRVKVREKVRMRVRMRVRVNQITLCCFGSTITKNIYNKQYLIDFKLPVDRG